MKKIKQFLKGTHILSRILFCAWIAFGLLLGSGTDNYLAGFGISSVIFLWGIIVTECLYNPMSRIYKRRVDDATAPQFLVMLRESLHLMNTTLCPQTFFGRYDDAVFSCERFLQYSHKRKYRMEVQNILQDLMVNRTLKIEEFVHRCYLEKKLYNIKDELLSEKYNVPMEIQSYVKQLLSSGDEEIITEEGEYIYCSVSFENSIKTYYYKTDDEDLQRGDFVIVPVGREERPEIARIERVERFSLENAPFPPSQTKNIIEKYEE